MTGILPPAVKRDRWDKVVERLLRVRILHESEQENATGVLRQWLRAYLAATESGDRQEALQNGYPHVFEGRLYLSREHFQTFIKNRFAERLARRDLQAALRGAGFITETVSYRRDNGRSTTASFYVRNIDEGDAT